MKKRLLLTALLGSAGCSSPSEKTASAPRTNPTQAAVVAFLKKTLDDPASYQPVHWGTSKPFRQNELDREKAADLLLEYRHQGELGQLQSEHFIHMSDIYSGTPKKALAELDKAKRVLAVYTHRADSVKALSDKLAASTDTTRLGQGISHAYRAKNKMAALVLDSAFFTVLKSGQVQVQQL